MNPNERLEEIRSLINEAHSNFELTILHNGIDNFGNKVPDVNKSIHLIFSRFIGMIGEVCTDEAQKMVIAEYDKWKETGDVFNPNEIGTADFGVFCPKSKSWEIVEQGPEMKVGDNFLRYLEMLYGALSMQSDDTSPDSKGPTPAEKKSGTPEQTQEEIDADLAKWEQDESDRTLWEEYQPKGRKTLMKFFSEHSDILIRFNTEQFKSMRDRRRKYPTIKESKRIFQEWCLARKPANDAFCTRRRYNAGTETNVNNEELTPQVLQNVINKGVKYEWE